MRMMRLLQGESKKNSMPAETWQPTSIPMVCEPPWLEPLRHSWGLVRTGLQKTYTKLSWSSCRRGSNREPVCHPPLVFVAADFPAVLTRDAGQARPGVFNQRAGPSSIWDGSDPDARRAGLAAATGGASEASSKAARLAELYRPPFELMTRLPWDDVRQKGKEESKWIIVNVQ